MRKLLRCVLVKLLVLIDEAVWLVSTRRITLPLRAPVANLWCPESLLPEIPSLEGRLAARLLGKNRHHLLLRMELTQKRAILPARPLELFVRLPKRDPVYFQKHCKLSSIFLVIYNSDPFIHLFCDSFYSVCMYTLNFCLIRIFCMQCNLWGTFYDRHHRAHKME